MKPLILALFGKRGCSYFALLMVLLLFSQNSYAQPDTIKYTGAPGFCPGGFKTLTADPTGTTYQWLRNGTPVSIAASYNANVAGTYIVVVNGSLYPTPLVLAAFSNPIANYTFAPNSQCGSVPVAFTNTSTGIGLSYLWNFGDPNSGANNTSTAANPIHKFIGNPGNGTQNFNVTLTVTSSEGCTNTRPQLVSIRQSPSTQLGGDGYLIYTDGFPYFTQCTSTASLFTFTNQAASFSTNTAYKIIWGDGSPDYVVTSFTTITHTYNVGIYSLQFIVNGVNGCSDTGNYKVFVGSNPAVGLGTPGNTNICTNSQLTFPITGTALNPIGTLYTVSFNDPNNVFNFQHPVPDSINHIFLINSCGYSSPGSNGANSFYAKIVATNPCGVSEGTVLPIHVSQKPTAAITILPKDTVCVNNPVTLTSSSSAITNVSTTGVCSTGKIVWQISPATGWAITSGSLGNDFNSNNLSGWISGSATPVINFNTPGSYTIKLKVGGNPLCGLDSITKTICVNPAPIGNFTLDTVTGCAPLTVTTTNTSNSPVCGSNTYNWTVSYAPTVGCLPNTIGFTYVGGTSATSANPQFQFTNPGVYTLSLVTKSSNGACTAPTVSKVVTVKSKPVVTISAAANICENGTITPTAASSCYINSVTTYLWTFTGGNPATSPLANPGTIIYTTSGTYLIEVAVTNECGTTLANKPLTVFQKPIITPTPNDTVCRGTTVGPFPFTSNVTGTTYTWTNNNTAIGLPAGGNGNVPGFVATNITANPITGRIIVSPVNGCAGTPDTFTITVYPTPVAPAVTTPVSYCQNTTAIPLTATAAANHTLNWYTVTTGGTASTTAPTPLTTTIGSTNYYVSQTNAGGCEGPRATIAVTINASPVLATAVPTNPTSCASATGFITLTGLTANTLYAVIYKKNGVVVGPINYTSNGTSNLIIPNLSSGTYDSIIVTRLSCPSNTLGPVSLVDPNPPATPTAGSNSPVCSGGSLSLTANATPGATYSWSGSGFTSNQQNPTIANVTTAASGNYSVTITVSGCTSGAGTVAVIVNPTPANITAGSNSPICSGDTLRLNSSSTTTGGLTYGWTGPNSFNDSVQNPIIPNATITASGTYTVIVKLGNCSAAPRSVNVLVRPTPVISDTSYTNPFGCTSPTGTISLIGLAGNTSYIINYLKNGVPATVTLSSNAAGVLTLFNLTPGTYSNMNVMLNTCRSNSVGPFVLIAPNPPTKPTGGSNSPVCTGNTLSLTASTTTTGTVSYNWTGPSGFTSPLQNPSIPNATVANSGNYVVTATINGCISLPDTVVVVVSATAATSNAGPDRQLCNTASATLAANAAGSSTGTWTVVAPSTATVAQINNPASPVSNLPFGTTKLVWTISNGVCQPTSDTIQITNLPALVNTVSPLSNTICSGQSITVTGAVPTGGSGTYAYQWQQSPDNISFSNIPGAVANSLTVSPTATTYYRRNIISGACAGSSDTALVTVLAGITGNSINSDQPICVNTAPLLLNGGLPSGGGGSFTYSWEQNINNGGWTLIPGATGQNYQPGVLSATTSYRRNTNTALCGGPQASVSNVATVTVNPDARAVFNPTDSVGCAPFNITSAIINHTPFNAAVSQYYWYVNGTQHSPNQAFPTYTMLLPGDTVTIKLVAISRFSCKNDSVQHGFKTINRPVPAFGQSDSVGCGPIKVYFPNTTPNVSAYSYNWSFGNGQTSTLSQPDTITFQPNPLGGDTVYTVTFKTVTQCDTIARLRYVRVKSKPKALFTPDRTTGCSSYNFTFTNTSRSSGTTTYTWDFGDGVTLNSNAPQVNHIYTVGNTTTFRVKLKATNECGTDSLIYNLVVTPITIRPDFAINGSDRFGCLPHTVRFINNSQGGSTFYWKFGDGDSLTTTNNIDTITHTYITAGTFTVRLRAVNSCSDTTDIEFVTVQLKPSVSFTATPLIGCTRDTIRFNNLSDTGLVYNWRFGDNTPNSPLRNPIHIYNTGGTFRVWLVGIKQYPSGVGCADSAFKDIVIRDTLSGSFTAGTVAATCLPASISFVNDNRPAALTTWMFGDGGTATGDSVNHTYTQAGTYTVKMISKGIAGCTYTATRTINIVGLSGTLQYNSGYLCPGIPFRMEVQSSTATQIRYFFGNGDSLTTTNAIINYTYPQPGVYVPYAYLLSANCLLRLNVGDTVKVDRLRTGFRTAQQQVCGRTTVAFIDTSNAFFGIRSWLWNFGDGTTSTQQNPVHTYTQNGTYQVRLRITGNSNCVDTITIPVTVAVRNFPVSTIAGDTVACIGQPLALSAIVQSADAIASYNWDFGNGTPGTGQNVTAVYNTIGTYTVRLITRTAFGCADTVYKIVRSNNSPIVSAGPDVTICRGQSIQIGAIGATTWQWSPLQGLSCTTCANPVANPLFTTSYIVTGSFGALCRANDTIRVQVIQPFNMTVSPTTTVCIGDSVPLFATGAYTYSWSPALSLNNANLSNPTAKPTVTTLYQVIGRDNFNCFTDTDYVRVNVGQYPTVDLGTGSTVVAGTTITLNPTITNGPITRYRWTPPTDLSCSNCPRPTATINNNISYKLEAENAFGCIGSDTINFRVNCDPNQLFIPNAFSPDGDGMNDVLMVRGKGISAVKYFRVFNRWGQMVFERSNINVNDQQQGWDGRINGVPAQPDVYVYTAEAVCTAGGTFVYKGNVTLVR